PDLRPPEGRPPAPAAPDGPGLLGPPRRRLVPLPRAAPPHGPGRGPPQRLAQAPHGGDPPGLGGDGRVHDRADPGAPAGSVVTLRYLHTDDDRLRQAADAVAEGVRRA